MNRDETEKLIVLVKGNWSKQPVDQPTITVWQAILKNLKLYEAWEAVMGFIREGMREPPTPGMICSRARGLSAEAAERARYQHKALPLHISPKEREKNRQFLHDLAEKLAEAKVRW
jgi:hypothetical protein